MITAGDFKKGITIEWDGGVWNIVDFQHVKPGKGAAFVRTKLKNVMTGAVIERSFNPTDKMPRAIVETKEMQYVYNDGGLYYFMDMDTYEQLPLNQDQVEEAIPFVKEGTNVTVKFFKGNAFSVAAPNFVELEITDEALHAIARKTIERKTGARGLRGILEETLAKLMFDAPSDYTIERIVITKGCVDRTGEPLILRDPERLPAESPRAIAEARKPRSRTSTPAS